MLVDILQPTKGVLKPPHEKQLEYLSQMYANALRKKLNSSQVSPVLPLPPLIIKVGIY